MTARRPAAADVVPIPRPVPAALTEPLAPPASNTSWPSVAPHRLLAEAATALARTLAVDEVLVCVEEVLLGLVGATGCALDLAGHADDGPTPLLLTRGWAGPPPGSAAPRAAGTLALPLVQADRVLGTWYLRGPDGPDGLVERALLEQVAEQVAQALVRGQLLERSRAASRVLQRALLPGQLPHVEGLEVATRYRSASGSEVGGDWYDVLPLPDRRVGLVLGDVMGRGVRAASTMAQVRNALRGIAVVDPTPVGMLTGLDAFFETFDADEITTVVLTVLDVATGRLHVANAGHLPPLVLRKDGRTGYLDDGASTPLGVPTVRVACKGTVLEAGDVLVMCSDGLIERRHWSLDEGLAVLRDTSRRLVDRGLGPEELADALVREVLEGYPTDDDVSLLVARRL